ncbi:kinesin-like protein KIF11 [Ylistrum balloti]|uniref:kinesin-like protein KIF11 n=1 Tax=Ylistrum balloti TaxID=509963 RepID=UPI0029058C13|nr:kinesin-like protein KIF11 [Ylistrum balloti]
MKPKTGDKNQNIKVSVRCRPINTQEKKQGSFSVLACNGEKKEVTVKERLGINPNTKSFYFDHVFPPSSKQMDVYQSVVTPIIDEVLSGYNCTIFAYGQTGSGKTFTMEGERTDDPGISWEDDPLAGIIPRAMSHIFEQLKTQDVEFSVRVSFLELYNEELFDLLGSGDDALRLRIYEDSTKKGSVIINGLEEVVVRSKNEVFEILQRGTARRQTAATLMNAHSSRSHTVFSVTVHIKESNIDGEELLKTGKLYLVDLAGSENIGRSGAVDKRAREAGSINQSLLTLGRVITSLVEHAPHIPYRESKLTRLLQDSLGGRTKTSIIATISPAACNLDETLSTLDYAHRAKNIQNRPEINQKLTKKALIREYTEEIERLRRDLQAVREKNGIYLAEENYVAMQNKITQQCESIKDMEENIAALTDEMNKLTEVYTETEQRLEETTKNLTVTTDNLIKTTENLHETKQELKATVQDRDEQKYLVAEHVSTETCLYGEAKELLATVDSALSDIDGLHSKLDRKKEVEASNEECQLQFKERFQSQITQMKEGVNNFLTSTKQYQESLIDKTVSLLQQQKDQVSISCQSVTDHQQRLTDQAGVIGQHSSDQTDLFSKWMDSIEEATASTQMEQTKALTEFQTDLLEPSVQCAVESNNLSATILQRQIELLHAQKTEQEEIVNNFTNKITTNLETLTKLTSDFFTLMTEDLEETERQTEEEERIDKELEEKIMQHQQKRLELLTKTRNRKRSRQQAVQQFLDTIMGNLQEVQTGTEQTKPELMGVVASNCTNNQRDLSQVLTEVDKCTGTCEDIKQKVSDINSQTQQVWSQHLETIKERISEHRETTRSGHEQHKVLAQSLVSEGQIHTDKLVSQMGENLQQWATQTQDRQTEMETQAQFTSDWSNNMSAELQKHSQDAETFLHEELRKDIPTGKTPQRRNITYPLQLTQTTEHDLLLNNFRADYNTDPLVTNLSSSLDAVAECSQNKTSETDEVESTPSEVGSESSCTSGVSSISRASSKMSRKENALKKPKLPSKTKQKNVNTTPRGKTRLPLKCQNQAEG